MTYNVFSGTLNSAQSVNQLMAQWLRCWVLHLFRVGLQVGSTSINRLTGIDLGSFGCDVLMVYCFRDGVGCQSYMTVRSVNSSILSPYFVFCTTHSISEWVLWFHRAYKIQTPHAWKRTKYVYVSEVLAMIIIILITHANVYGAVFMTKAIARVYPVHLMNADRAPGGRQPSEQAKRLGVWVRQ